MAVSDAEPLKTTTPTKEKLSKGEPSEGNGGLAIAGLILLGAVPILFIFGMTLGVFRGNGPNSAGAQAPQVINIAHPSTELKSLLDTFSAASNTQAYLANKGAVLDTYASNLTLLQQKIQSGDPKYTTGLRDKDGILQLIPTMLTEITTLKADVTAAQKTKLVTDAKMFQADIQKLNLLAAPDIATTALNYAAANAASGYTKYTYSKDNRAQFPTTHSGQSDCSSFVSTMLYDAGYLRVPEIFTTVGLYDAAKAGKFGLQLVTESTSSSGIANDTVKADLQPGDVILSAGAPYSQGGDSQNHAVLYVGNNQVVESTDAGGKNGIQTDSLDNRLKRHTQAIIRGGIAS